MDPFSAKAVRAAYDVAASEYVVAFGDDLARLPLDRAMLDETAASLPAGGLALDLGCGPGTVAAYLRRRSVPVIGVDLSFEMLTAAGQRAPRIPLLQADMRRLPLAPASTTLVVAYYSIHSVPRADISGLLSELRRILTPGGMLLLATHLGEGDVYVSEFLGHQITSVGGTLYTREEIVGHLEEAGFRVEMERQRDPLHHEYSSRRIYALARAGLRGAGRD